MKASRAVQDAAVWIIQRILQERIQGCSNQGQNRKNQTSTQKSNWKGIFGYVFNKFKCPEQFNVRKKIVELMKNQSLQSKKLCVQFRCFKKSQSFSSPQIETWVIQILSSKRVKIQETQSQLFAQEGKIKIFEFMQQVLTHIIYETSSYFARISKDKCARKYYVIDFQIKILQNIKSAMNHEHTRLDYQSFSLFGPLSTVSLSKYYNDSSKKYSFQSGSTEPSIHLNLTPARIRTKSLPEQEVYIVTDRKRKVSHYQIYDQELDMTILSSGSEQLKKAKSDNVNEVFQHEPQFGLIQMRDLLCIEQCRTFFNMLGQLEQDYLN